ncbi:MAG: ATPase, T2SS/T4P/T4SS family [Proteobacteria bacterium]|nr:ATPase, T2SS/T4P/T4SS family [Pseudomonadota bacterium]
MQNIKGKSKRTGELLFEAGLITEAQLNQALEKQKEGKKKIGEALVEMGFVSEKDIVTVLSVQLGIPLIDFSTVSAEPEAFQIVPETICRKHTVVPISLDKDTIQVVFADPLDFEAIDAVRFVTGKSVQPAISTSKEIKESISHYYHMVTPLQNLVDNLHLQSSVEVVYGEKQAEIEASELIKRSEAPPVVKMVNGMIVNAFENRASDAHIEPQQKIIKLRERIDGLLRDVMTLPKWVQGLVTSRIKIMAGMDITEKRIPQDGKIKIRIRDRELDLRVSTLPAHYGENIVIRILDAQSRPSQLEQIGFSDEDLAKVKSLIERPQGLVLITGPTGSGKTSTQYAMINHIKSEAIHIVTLEDPVEYEVPGATQVQINEKVGLTFPFSLRSVLRQDPDVILVGEIRDIDTAFISMQASITGHLVLSSIHTLNAISTIARLKNMGILPYLISPSLNGIIAQRLVRLICPHCKTSYKLETEEIVKVGIVSKAEDAKGLKFYKGKGCEKCGNTGYRGRTGIYEVFVVNQQIRDLIASDAPEEAISKAALSSGMKTLWYDGLKKVKEGFTTIEELNRVLTLEEEEMTVFCPSCNASIKSEFISCPYCGYAIASVCHSCGKAKEAGWNYCPYCKAEFTE